MGRGVALAAEADHMAGSWVPTDRRRQASCLDLAIRRPGRRLRSASPAHLRTPVAKPAEPFSPDGKLAESPCSSATCHARVLAPGEGSPMRNYLIKCFDAQGRLADRFEFAAPDDTEAEAALTELPGCGVRELWCGRRWLVTLPAEHRPG